jgi:hypothetical protein
MTDKSRVQLAVVRSKTTRMLARGLCLGQDKCRPEQELDEMLAQIIDNLDEHIIAHKQKQRWIVKPLDAFAFQHRTY